MGKRGDACGARIERVGLGERVDAVPAAGVDVPHPAPRRAARLALLQEFVALGAAAAPVVASWTQAPASECARKQRLSNLARDLRALAKAEGLPCTAVSREAGVFLVREELPRGEAAAALPSRDAVPAAAEEVRLGVVELHSISALREEFYRVVRDLQAAGAIVDVWLMDLRAVLRRHGYEVTVTRSEVPEARLPETEGD